MLKSKGVIRSTLEEGDKLLVSFPAHDGYFYVQDPILRAQIGQAEREQREITFTFDSNLRILSLS